ncbi:stage V sporulation protein AD, partial [Lawsonibacter sp. DFI.6.74]|nr:stage V sporulation protein AD [Lawsonibacter sp. DFI.6.74]
TIISTSSIVGPKEANGPLKEYFDMKLDDDLFGEKSWEFAESKMVQTVVENAIKNGNKSVDDIDYMIAGDL